MEYRKLKDIKLLDRNPRTIRDDDFKKLVQSIEANPDYFEARPLILSDRTGELVIIAGNQRYRAAKELKLKEVPTFLIKDLTEEREKEIIIRDNVSNGEWDFDLLANEWNTDDLEDWGLDIPNFVNDEVLEAEEDDFDATPPEEPITVLGDLYEIGEHRLLCGDSTQTDTFEKLFNGQMADMVLTDPPYNVDYEGKTKQKLRIKNDNKSDVDFYQFLYDFYTALGTYTKSGGAWYVWQPDKQIHRFIQSFEDSGFKYSGLNVWVKNTLVMGRGDYHSKHETCIYGWKEGAAHGWYSDRKQTTVLNFDKPNRNAEHPTMKPIPLFAYQIGNSSKQGDIVADGFGGSGTTMVACEQMKRKGYLVEFDPKYCDVIVKRMIKLDDTLTVKRNGIDVTKEFK